MLLLILLGGPALAEGTAGVSVGLLAARNSAAHDLAPLVGAWGSLTHRPVGASLELQLASRAREGELYRYVVHTGRAAATLDLALGTRASNLRFGLGPALTLRRGTASWQGAAGTLQAPFHELAPGLRARLALDGPVRGGVGYTVVTGATTRGEGLDLDVSGGLGVAW